MVKYKTPKNILKKSVIVGLVLLFFDYLGHTFLTGTQETLFYYLAKPLIAGYIAYFMFLGMYNIFSLKKNTPRYYIYYAALFALIHGLYYRVLDFMQGNPFFFRVRDIVLNDNVIFMGSNILSGMLGWGILHGGSFLIGIWIAKKFVK